MNARRARGRADWPVEVRSLAEPERNELSRTTTAEQRIAMIWPLTLEGWALAGRQIPDYPREKTPVTFRSSARAR